MDLDVSVGQEEEEKCTKGLPSTLCFVTIAKPRSREQGKNMVLMPPVVALIIYC